MLRIRMNKFKEYRDKGRVFDYEYGWIEHELPEEIKMQLVEGNKAKAYKPTNENQEELNNESVD